MTAEVSYPFAVSYRGHDDERDDMRRFVRRLKMRSLLLCTVVAACGLLAATTSLVLSRTHARFVPWPSIQAMNAAFEDRFTRSDSISPARWNASLPTDAERAEISALVLYLSTLEDFAELDVAATMKLYPTIARSINLTVFDDYHVVIHEPLLADDRPFPRFWGYVVLTSKLHAARPFLHFSSPHFQSDGDVCNETAALFEQTRGRSLVVSGASRYAVLDAASSPCDPAFRAADGAHNDRTAFHVLNVAVLEASRVVAFYEDRLLDDYFLQWHGMAETSCHDSPALVSAGARGTAPVYLNESAAVNRLCRAYGSTNAHTPAADRGCNLAATTNVFGRLVNGVPASQVCLQNAPEIKVSGHFIHIEQKKKQRHDWNGWSKALDKTFRNVTST